MKWCLEEALSYYRTQGAPADQSALVALLREIQRENGGGIPLFMVATIAQAYEIKENFLLAIIKRFPSLRLSNCHCLELCAGPNCGKHVQLAEYAEKLQKESRNAFSVRFTPCMRMCGKGPNIKWDGLLYSKADTALLKKLLNDAGIDC